MTVGDRLLFRDLSFDWVGPSLVAVIGPSGSGKSTLLAAVLGWMAPTSGRLSVHPDRSGMWLAPQNAPLLDSRTVRDNLAAALLTSGTRDEVGETAGHDLAAMSDTFALSSVLGTRARHLSGGERQRVALARAALRRPTALLADEVTAGLDPVSVGMVTHALRALVGAGALVVTATHDQRVWSAADVVLDLGADR